MLMIEHVSKLIDLLLDNPPVALLVVASLAAIALVKPILSALADHIGNTARARLLQGNAASTWNRVKAFILLLHFGVGVAAVVWCYFATDLPPPAVSPDYHHPLGPKVDRLMGYLLALMGCLFALVSLVLYPIANDRTAQIFKHGPSVMFAGVLTAIPFVTYGALVDPRALANYSISPIAASSIPWWYCWVSIFSFSLGLAVVLAIALLRWIWRCTAIFA